MELNIRRILKAISAILIIFIIFFFLVLYSGLIDWKKTLIVKISSEATIAIGQRVNIGDLSLKPLTDLNLYDINIQNPKSFGSGRLLHIKIIKFKLNLRELIRGKIFFDRITIGSPKLTIRQDKTGNFNISNKLKLLFKKEGKGRFKIDELKIKSGLFDLSNNKRYRIEAINLSIENFSLDSNKKVLIEGSVQYWEENRIDIDGWINLKANPKTFNIHISSKDFCPPIFKKISSKYKIDTERSKIGFDIQARGDIEKEIVFHSKTHLLDMGFSFLNKKIKKIKDILIELDGHIDIRDESIFCDNFILRTDNYSDIYLKGMIKKIIEDPVYEANIKIRKIDLSALNLVPDIKVTGILTSKGITVKGNRKRRNLTVSGTLRGKNIKTEAFNKYDTYLQGSEKLNRLKKIPSFTINDINFVLGVIKRDSDYNGKVVVDAKGVSVLKRMSKRKIVGDAILHSEFLFDKDNIKLNSNIKAGALLIKASGLIEQFRERGIEIEVEMPEIEVNEIRDSLWDIFPDKFLYAGLKGYTSLNALLHYHNGEIRTRGDLILKDFIIEGENKEYSIGPVNGIIPLDYNNRYNNREDKKELSLPSFERNHFEELEGYLLKIPFDSKYKITIGYISYGFRLIKDVSLFFSRMDNTLNIKRFAGSIFGGRLSGFAIVNFTERLNYNAGILIKGLSLTKLCKGIRPIQGYISGNVDGIAQIKGFGKGLSQLIGNAEFWTYPTETEKTKISRIFLQKIGGPSLKTYLRDRNFDKGIMNIYVKNGYIIFKELEISNRNLLGIKDLSVKVAPYNNRILIKDLLWTIIEAAHRAKKG